MAKKKLLNNPYIDLNPDELLQLAIKTKDIQEKNLIEEIIADNSMLSYKYAMDYLHERFLKGEPTLMKNASYAFHYAKNILKARWIEAEPYIEKHEHFGKHYKRFLEILGSKEAYINSDEELI